MNSQRRCVSWLPPGGSQGVQTFSLYALVVAPPGFGIEWFDKRYQLPTRVVGADRIRPWHKAPRRGCSVGVDILVDPYRACANRFLGSTEPGGSGNQCIGTSPVRYCPAALPPGRILSAPTGRVRFTGRTAVPNWRLENAPTTKYLHFDVESSMLWS